MRKKILILLVAFFALGAQQALAQMSDEQIITYITQGIASGKTERQIGTELMAKGVTTSQLQRLLKQYKSGSMSASDVPSVSTKLDGTKSSRKPVSLEEESGSPSVSKKTLDNSRENLEKKARTKPRKKDKSKSLGTLKMKKEVKIDPATGLPVPTTEEEVEEEEFDPLYDEDGYRRIYGLDIFSSQTLSFEPNVNQATPEDYVLGPGDEVLIDVWGQNEASISQKISPEGRIIISQVGPIQLAGLTVKQARGKVKSALSKPPVFLKFNHMTHKSRHPFLYIFIQLTCYIIQYQV